MARQGETMTHRTLSQSTATTSSRQPFPLRQPQQQPYSTLAPTRTASTTSSTATSSPSSTSPAVARRFLTEQHQQQSQQLAGNDNTELDWKYLSTTETYTSEYSSVASDEYEEDGTTAHNSAQVSDSSAGSRVVNTVQRGQGARTFLVPATNSSSTATMLSLSASKEADDSTDTIKGMRARALDKANGRKASTSNLSASSGNLPGSNDYSPYRRTGATTATISGVANSVLTSSDASGGGSSTNTANGRIKRRSLGASDRSQSLCITTSSGSTITANASSSSAKLGANPSTPPTLLRKRSSGPIKIQQQLQRALLTSEDDSEVPSQTVYQDRARYTSEGGILVNEIKALKARVQELEIERMNRSLTSLSVQSPQVMTPKSMDHSTTTSLLSVGESMQHQSQPISGLSHSEKLQQIIQKHRGSSSASLESASPLKSPMIAAISDTEGSKDQAVTKATAGGRLEPSLSIASPVQSPLLASSTSRQTTTQHIDLLNIALKSYEKWTRGTTSGSSSNPSFQAISRVVTNAISMNQTIRAWVKADVSLVESSSMNVLQRASDEQIRSLTEYLLAVTRVPPTMTSLDRSNNLNNNSVSDTESITGNGPIMNRPYSPRLSAITHHRFDQGQRLSLGMAANEIEAGGYDPNPPYPVRPLSTTAIGAYETLGNGTAGVTPNNGVASSGYLARTDLTASTHLSDSRMRNSSLTARYSQGGYSSDYSYDRQPSSSTFQNFSRNQLHQQQHQLGEGAYPNQESSPPQEDPRGPVPRRQTSGLLTMSSPQLANMAVSRNLQSSQHFCSSTGSIDVSGSNNQSVGQQQQQQLTRRQASVRNIVARYSQGSKSPTPNMNGYESQSEVLGDSVMDRTQDNGNDRPVSMLQYSEGLRSPLINSRQAGQDYRNKQHQGQRPLQDEAISALEGTFGPGYAQVRLGGSIRRPLSQQDHRNTTGSRLSEPGDGRHGFVSLGVRAGQRYIQRQQQHAGAFSEDENANSSDWKGGSQSSNGNGTVETYSAQLRQLRGRHEQQLPFHQEGLSFEEPYPQKSQQFQQPREQYGEGFAEGVGKETGDALMTEPIPRFAQRQSQYQTTQSQYLDKSLQYRQASQYQHQNHHQDMLMSTPSLPSPNSSPSSSARLDAPSLMMSLSNHGQGGGLAAIAGAHSTPSSGGVDGRYHLSPRGTAGAATFPRQNKTGYNGDEPLAGSYHGQQNLGGARRMPVGALQVAQ
ncbi:hypothetical protein FBU30_005625 [Linnemannia zychae]|nr:hypothetical protein FBU30_005625 [Linnemannia zychae]